MADSGFVYQADSSSDEYLIFNSSSEFDSEFDYIRNLMAEVDFLTDSLSLRIYPMGYPDSDFDLLVRSRPNKENFLLPAAIFDKDFELISFLLVERNGYQRAMVISKNKDVIADIHGSFHFKDDYSDDLLFSMKDFLRDYCDRGRDIGLVLGAKPTSSSLTSAILEATKETSPKVEGKKKEKYKAPKPAVRFEPSEEEEYVPPKLETTFVPVPNKKKKIGRIVLPEEERKTLPESEAKKQVTPAKEEEPPKPQVASTQEKEKEPSPIIKPYFEANKKRASYQIKDEPKPEEKLENLAKPQSKPTIQPSIPVFQKPFSAEKKKKQISMEHVPSSFFGNEWRASKRIDYRPDYGKGKSKIVVYSKGSSLDYYVQSEFKKPRKVDLHKNCTFRNTVPEPFDELPNLFVTISTNRFYFLASYLDIYGKPYSYLISLKEDPDLCGVLVKGKSGYFIFSISDTPIYIQEIGLYSGSLLPKCYPEDFPDASIEEEAQTPKEEPKPKEEPSLTLVKETLKPEETKAEEKLSITIKEGKRTRAVERRKIYYTPYFKKKFDAFLEDHHAKGQKDFDDFLFNLQTLPDEELSQFLIRKHVKRIHFSKMHLSNDSEYAASRIFYLTHDQFEGLGRRIEPGSMVLFAFSDQQEHDIQSEVEAKGLAALAKDSTILCFPCPSSEVEEEKLYVLSSVQNEKLDQSTSSLPAAVLGAAGSGKTLMSYQAYLELCASAEDKVLYVTYERKLKDKAQAVFEELGVKNATALTFKELMKVIHVDDRKRVPQFKNDFHDWFFFRKEKDFINKANILSPNKEDAFSTAYVFYRGVIEGSLRIADKKGDASKILTREEFKEATEDEYGLTLEQKDAIYDIALAYERHLKSINGITDNKYALRLIEEAKRDIFDAIVVDEYQDLTELQLYAICKVLKPAKPHRLLLFGDDNQAVNPTILNLAGINKVLFKAFEERLTHFSLLSTYRTGKSLFTYITDVLRIKNDAIGKDKKENTAPTSTFRDDEQDLYITLLENEVPFEPLLLAARKSNLDAVFIFPSAASRDEAKEKYKDLIADQDYLDDNFLSVEESKGREWDSCILVDFISSSKATFEAMLGEGRVGHRSTLHRMLFNRYYVALTRAENRIVVYESDAGELAKEKLLSPLTKLKSLADIERIFTGDLNPKYWIGHGDELFSRGRYEEALRAYRRGKDDPESESRQEKARLYIKASEEEELSESSVELFLRYEDIDALSKHYERVDLARFELLSVFSSPSSSLKEKQQAFLLALPRLFDCEKDLFFRDLCLLYKQRIMDSINVIKRRNNSK